jgi:hypothetical protein
MDAEKPTTLDSESPLPQYSLQCGVCQHIRDTHLQRTCRAFPDGIPPDVWNGVVRHDHPIKGDHGLQFQRDPYA